MEDFERKDFCKILKSAGLEAVRWMKQTDSNTCRVYDRAMESLPLTVDLYGHYARVMDYSEEGLSEEEVEEIIDLVSRYLYVERSKVVYTTRKKREGREQHEKGNEETKVEVLENGLKFECELSLYADTGLFLDQAKTRAMVMEMAQNQRVLNLFSYTSSFSVYAAKGGAESVVSVDLSNVYTAWSRRNLENNGFLDEGKYEVIAGDARKYLEEAVKSNRKFDIVIFDPPAFSNSHKAEDFDVQKDYVVFLSLISQILSDGGVVVFSENLSGFRFEKSKLERYYEVREITKDVHALNFSSKKGSARVWVLEKTATMKTVERRAVTKRKVEITEMENKNEESLERLTLSEETVETGKTEKRAGKSAPRAFSFDDTESAFNTEDRSERKERRDRQSDDRRDRRDGGRERRFSDDRRSSYGRDDRREGRRDFSSRDDRRERRFSDDRRSSYGRDDRREGRRDFSSRGDRPRYSEDRRSSRYSDEKRDFSYRENREGDRYSDRPSRFSDDRRSERPSRFSDDRRSSYGRDDRRGFGSRDRFSSDRRDDRRPSRFSSDSRSFGGRRDNEGRRDNYKRDSFPGRDRSFRSADRDWDNDTSKMYRSERGERSDRRDGERKKSSPKPYGYDSFHENKVREGATAFWLESQVGYGDKD